MSPVTTSRRCSPSTRRPAETSAKARSSRRKFCGPPIPTVILEFGFKSEGAVPLDEFKDPESIEPGQEVEVLLESLEDDDGVVVLSKKEGGLPQGLGADQGRVRERPPREGPADAQDQGWGDGGHHGRGRLPAGIPDRPAASPQHRGSDRGHVRLQDHQAQQAPSEHRRLAQGHPRAGEEEEAFPRS